MTAPAWTVGTDGAGALSTSLTVTAPSTAAGELALIVVSGVCSTTGTPPASVTVTRSGTGATTQTVVPTAAVNVWICVWAVQGVAASEQLTITGDLEYYMTVAAAGYGGVTVGASSTVAVRAASSTDTVVPAFTTQSAASTVVDLWSARDSGSGGLTSVTTGTIRISQRSTAGNLTPVAAISDYTPGSTAVGTVTGTFATASGNGAGLQVELVSPVQHNWFRRSAGAWLALDNPVIVGH